MIYALLTKILGYPNEKSLRKILGAALIAILASAQIVFASFPDVTASHPNYNAINYLQSNNIVSGYKDGTFKPDHQINRAEFTKITVGAALNYNSSKDSSDYDIYSLSGISFMDAEAGAWYIPYLRKAVEKKIISGYLDGTFKQAKNISFVEATKIIVNSFGYTVYADAIWYKPYVNKLAEMKAIPTTISSFDAKITRGEMAEMIYRVKAAITTKNSLTYDQLNEHSGTTSMGSVPRLSATCTVFPADNSWNRDISGDPLNSNSANYISYISGLGGNQFLHADFGGNGQYGIPYVLVTGGQSKVPITFVDYSDESDPGPYPIPQNAPIENGSDQHVLVADKDNCKLYELFNAKYIGSGWQAGSGAIFDLTSNALRPETWTSADAAGLPIFAGLAKYSEVTTGSINHALRFTLSKSQKAYIHPATHQAGSTTNVNAPPMGLRFRLKISYDISGFTGQSRIILETLKKYGLILADNGSNWFISGDTDTHWNDDDLNQLKTVPGTAFEVVNSR